MRCSHLHFMCRIFCNPERTHKSGSGIGVFNIVYLIIMFDFFYLISSLYIYNLHVYLWEKVKSRAICLPNGKRHSCLLQHRTKESLLGLLHSNLKDFSRNISIPSILPTLPCKPEHNCLTVDYTLRVE